MNISLYEVTASSVEKVLPKLLEKAYQAGKRALVIAESEEKVEELSHVLWTYAQQSFLAHGTKKDGRADHQPIWLTNEVENPNNASILILLDGRQNLDIESYERCLDLFDGTQQEFLHQAKLRQALYEKAGHQVTYWCQDSLGQWIKN